MNVLLCTNNLDLTSAFYAALGIELIPEKHGAGPDHLSFSTETVVEIYPPRVPADATFVLRFEIDNIVEKMHYLRSHFHHEDLVIADIQTLTSGKKSILRDPDGRVIELVQSFKPR